MATVGQLAKETVDPREYVALAKRVEGQTGHTRFVQSTKYRNPNVTFRRIRGRVVPIVNRQRTGRKIRQIGGKGMKYGAMGLGGVAIASGLSRTKLAEALGKDVESLKAALKKYAQRPIPKKNLERLGRAKRYIGDKALKVGRRITSDIKDASGIDLKKVTGPVGRMMKVAGTGTRRVLTNKYAIAGVSAGLFLGGSAAVLFGSYQETKDPRGLQVGGE